VNSLAFSLFIVVFYISSSLWKHSHDLAMLAFCCCDKIPEEINLNEVFLALGYRGFRLCPLGSIHFRVYGKESSWYGVVKEQSCLGQGSQESDSKREIIFPGHAPNNLLSPTRTHLVQFLPLPSSPFNYKHVNGLIY
jgi:hypothetical protein